MTWLNRNRVYYFVLSTFLKTNQVNYSTSLPADFSALGLKGCLSLLKNQTVIITTGLSRRRERWDTIEMCLLLVSPQWQSDHQQTFTRWLETLVPIWQVYLNTLTSERWRCICDGQPGFDEAVPSSAEKEAEACVAAALRWPCHTCRIAALIASPSCCFISTIWPQGLCTKKFLCARLRHTNVPQLDFALLPVGVPSLLWEFLLSISTKLCLSEPRWPQLWILNICIMLIFDSMFDINKLIL